MSWSGLREFPISARASLFRLCSVGFPASPILRLTEAVFKTKIWARRAQSRNHGFPESRNTMVWRDVRQHPRVGGERHSVGLSIGDIQGPGRWMEAATAGRSLRFPSSVVAGSISCGNAPHPFPPLNQMRPLSAIDDITIVRWFHFQTTTEPGANLIFSMRTLFRESCCT